MICSKMIRFLIFTFFFFNYSFADNSYDVQDFGADPNGNDDSSKAFLGAWAAACETIEPATIYVPPGKYVLSQTVFEGHSCSNNAITIKIDGTLSLARSDYYKIATDGHWLVLQDVTGVTIHGGRLSGRGKPLWYRKESDQSCPLGATSLAIYNSQDVTINALTSKNSQMFHILIYGCQNVNLINTKIFAPENSPNTDGIHIAQSSEVTISNSEIRTGDDCISIGPGSSNLWIENIFCGPGHGISIGSLGWDDQEKGVENVTVKTATLTGTQNGVRIKTRGTPVQSYVKNVLFQNIFMIDSENPVVIDQNYCPDKHNCPGQDSAVAISDITYQDVQGTSATQVAVKFDCSNKNPCSGIMLDRVKLTYNGPQATALCNNIDPQISGVVWPRC